MRAIITGSTLFICIALLFLTHCVIIGNNARESEVSNGLNSSMDYAYDKMIDYYYEEDFSAYYVNGTDATKTMIKDTITKDLMNEFCSVLQKRIGSDGTIKVQLLYIDLDTGTFQLKVTEFFQYPLSLVGQCAYEKTYSLY